MRKQNVLWGIGRFLFLWVLLSEAWAGEALAPAFPNHAAVFPHVAPRDVSGPVNPGPPFSWTQTIVMKENASNTHLIGAFDPLSQPISFQLLPSTPQSLEIKSFDNSAGLITVRTLPDTAGSTEQIDFQVTARGITNPVPFSLIYEIHSTKEHLRGLPHLISSPGEVIQPGQIVRYTWSQISSRKQAKYDALLSGLTGPATGLALDNLTPLVSVKAQPLVLGYYLMLVTPQDAVGEAPLGSTSNGLVFQCALGSQDLPPVTQGLAANTFLPAAGQAVTVQPVAVDPQTGQTVFDNETYDFGDSTVLSGVDGQATYTYTQPGIYCARCTVTSAEGLSATAQDNIIVGATIAPKMYFKFFKSILPIEAGDGDPNEDNLSAIFKGASAGPGDRVVFVYNRNRFGRMSSVDSGDSMDIVLGPGGGWSGATNQARNVTVQGGKSVSITVDTAQFDITGDPRFGIAELKGIFEGQRIAVCIVPADGSTPRVYAYTGNIRASVKGGALETDFFVPETSITGSATTRNPNPNQQPVF